MTLFPAKVVDNMTQLGYPANVVRPIGIVQALIGILLLIPQTTVLGGLLITAYLGGATATHVHASQPFILPVILGVVVWIGLLLRDGGDCASYCRCGKSEVIDGSIGWPLQRIGSTAPICGGPSFGRGPRSMSFTTLLSATSDP